MFLQDGSGDLDNEHGNWFLANQQMEKALAFANKKADEAKGKEAGKGGDAKAAADARYDIKFVAGEGTHSGKHGGAILPDTMRWLWRDYKKP